MPWVKVTVTTESEAWMDVETVAEAEGNYTDGTYTDTGRGSMEATLATPEEIALHQLGPSDYEETS